MERQQSKIDKKHWTANAALKSGGLTKVRTGDWWVRNLELGA
jgi:hypothetical protein